MDIDYRIVIPTKDRSNIILKKTLGFLIKHKIDLSKVDILLGQHCEAEEYRKVLDGIWDYEFIYHYEGNLGTIMNFVRGYYKYETNVKYLLRLDDDIDEIIDRHNKPIEDFNKLIIDMFRYTEDKDLCYWGIAPFDNYYFLKDKITTDLKFIVGPLNGEIINRDKHDIQIDTDEYEDSAFTCEFFLRDGGVVRHNGYGVVTKFNAKGGMVSAYGDKKRRLKEMNEKVYHLKERYGDMINIIERKHRLDIRLNRTFKC